MEDTQHKGPLLARGRTAEVFAWGEGQVIKLYMEGWEMAEVEHEARNAKAAYQSGFTVPAVGDVVEMEGRYGLIYERIEGESLLELLRAKPWRLAYYARMLAELHAVMHARQGKNLPSQRKSLQRKIERAEKLNTPQRENALHLLAALPDNDCLCHGDFHPDNVMLTANGPVIIDWVDGSQGSPLADVARTVIISTVGDLPEDMPMRRLLNLFRHQFSRLYLKHYFRLRPGGQAEYRAWMAPVAAARLVENIPGQDAALIRIVEQA